MRVIYLVLKSVGSYKLVVHMMWFGSFLAQLTCLCMTFLRWGFSVSRNTALKHQYHFTFFFECRICYFYSLNIYYWQGIKHIFTQLLRTYQIWSSLPIRKTPQSCKRAGCSLTFLLFLFLDFEVRGVLVLHVSAYPFLVPYHLQIMPVNLIY